MVVASVAIHTSEIEKGLNYAATETVSKADAMLEEEGEKKSKWAGER